ncbi:MAG: metal-dependent transcriptional regulator [Acidobacteria bacterium]|nr:metal-dependent transcriptional regulator [Acidobacteriota bacterium]
MILSEAIENYLKAIFLLCHERGRATTTALADWLEVAPASVSGMLKKLSSDRPKLVQYTRHRGVSLTPAGEKIALEVIRHHRLIEMYLHQALGYSWDQVHDEAEKLEHVISEEFEDRIAEKLGHPEFDPHGDPIPTKNGELPKLFCSCLSTMSKGQTGRVRRVRNSDPALLRYLAELGIVPDATLTVSEQAPFGGTLHVQVGAEPGAAAHALGRPVTDQVFVEVDGTVVDE